MDLQDRVPSGSRRTPLATVTCALCGQPVAHMSKVTASLAGGMCTRESCVKDPKSPDKRRQVYTFNRMVDTL